MSIADELERIRDKNLIPTPDKDHTDYAVMTQAINALRGFEWLAGVYDGEKLTTEKVGAELSDYHFILGEVPKVYDHVTGGLLSKPNYHANVVIAAADDHVTRLVRDELADLAEASGAPKAGTAQ
jgi:hypothetical protein